MRDLVMIIELILNDFTNRIGEEKRNKIGLTPKIEISP